MARKKQQQHSMFHHIPAVINPPHFHETAFSLPLKKKRDSGRSSGSHFHSPTAMLEQVQERLDSMAQDMYILNNRCGEEVVRSSLVRACKGGFAAKAQEAPTE